MLGDYPIVGRGATEIAAALERAVGEGAVRPGEALPPMRELAQRLGVNHNTVAAAYRLLRDRGVIETAGRRGSRVRGRPATAPRDAIRVDVPPGARDLSSGNPDPALLPPLGAPLAAAAERLDLSPVLYGSPAVDADLAARAREAFDRDGVPAGPVAVTSGSLDAVERALQAHLRPGDKVAVEDPGWGSLLDLVPALGLRPVPVGVDASGPVPESVDAALRAGVRALVVTSRAQNPTGAAVDEDRARELRTLLAAHPAVLVVEDDHGHGIVDLPLHPLGGAADHWVIVRSAAKVYGPDLRLAVLTGDRITVDRLRGRHRLGPGWVSHLLQLTAAELMRSGAVDPAVAAASYGRRRDALVAALRARGVRGQGRSGMNVWVPVPDETRVVSRLLTGGWAVAPGARFRLESEPGIRVTVSTLAMGDIAPLADAIAAAAGPSGAGRYG